MKELLIIFVKNPELGKVKTRLADDIGNDGALRVYQQLLLQTFEITQNLPFEKWVYYSDNIDVHDFWEAGYSKKLQNGNDLGERILKAFSEAFDAGFERVCIIGSDCFELTSDIIKSAFSAFDENSFVIGPAKDGGYYLLGMDQFEKQVFLNKNWSTSEVGKQTINNFELLNKPYHVLPELSDIDTIDDLESFPDLKALAQNTDAHTD
ncbi:MAG: TIGR04282 family arsenosugar biosynthesis glycosyltransferase [Bacteroidetes bacterium]|nr:TIGR04282 family arsenosugar biosynthesis glycosyltransferase [Bacteroidota bacterium]MDA1121654.1 TIGR04282 family arsenosugar biosynthesis glycosyltransferase [Bacteroidota bacterium]